MAGPSDEFEDPFGDDARGPLLPPEDRLWRHPSEVASISGPLTEQARIAQDRWLSNTPSRAGAWSAGLVGAILATGVVFVGMHLTSWIGRSHGGAASRLSASTLPAATTTFATYNGDNVARVESNVARSIVYVSSGGGAGAGHGDGLVVSADGTLVVPLSVVAGASAVTVTTGQDEVFTGRVIGTDQQTGLAVVAIQIGDLAPIAPDASLIQTGMLMVSEYSAPTRNSDDGLRTVSSFLTVRTYGDAAAQAGGYMLSNWIRFDHTRTGVPSVGAVLLDGAGAVGLVTARSKNEVIAVSTAEAVKVASEIVQYGTVQQGWIDVKGVPTGGEAVAFAPNAANSGLVTVQQLTASRALPAGVKIMHVGKASTAAVAGLKPGDVIAAVNGRAIASMNDLDTDLYLCGPHGQVNLTVLRGNSIRSVWANTQKAA